MDKIIAFKVKPGDSAALRNEVQPTLSSMRTEAGKRYDQVVGCWAGGEFTDSPLDEWLKERHPDHKEVIVEQVVDDLTNYLYLTLNWPIITRAILRLRAQGNRWLYEEPASSQVVTTAGSM